MIAAMKITAKWLSRILLLKLRTQVKTG